MRGIDMMCPFHPLTAVHSPIFRLPSSVLRFERVVHAFVGRIKGNRTLPAPQ
ncbi:predicted protein [Botrytis cinerea T4]|uniref:Uncharacterized protein n=1 Tax=Botryotinia fuckeliana (strain T4) TaxID=999810 RepID=G2Y393_BOTF4|nr:predicted protein [Botrytis cinerea T4]